MQMARNNSHLQEKNQQTEVDESLIQEINQHFAEEMKLKKQIFELEQTYDKNEQELDQLMNTTYNDNKATKDRFTQLNLSQEKLLKDINELQKNYEKFAGKRNHLLSVNSKLT